jgi:putrescine transport system permease protein
MTPGKGTLGEFGARLVVWVPYAWLVVFFLAPFLIVLKISLSQTAIALPPYVPVLELDRGWSAVKDFVAGLGLDNYATLLSDEIYGLSYLKSLEIAAVSTAILLAIGYPLAYGMARAPRRAQSVLVMLVILPFWTSFLIRVYAWINILQTDGLLNRVLDALHVIALINRVRAVLGLDLIEAPVAWLASDTAIYIGIVYSYLPFMVLPLYATLEKMDFTLLEAAADLGARPAAAFWRVTVPLSLPGVAAGALLCFIPITGEFVIPDLLGGSDSLMIGQTLWTEFFSNKDWPVASAIAVVLLVLLVGPIMVYQHLQTKSAGA